MASSRAADAAGASSSAADGAGASSRAAGPPGPDLYLGGRLRLLQSPGGYRAGTDAVLLAACVDARPGQSALDLGCGAGAAILALGLRVGGLRLAGLEIQASCAALARANARLNAQALAVHEGCVTDPPPTLAGAFDHVLMNPPFFDRAASRPARDPAREAAHGQAAPLAAWIALAARRLAPGGRLHLVHRTGSLPAILAALPAWVGSVEVLPLAPRPGEEARSMLLRARHGGRAPFRLHAPLALHQADSPRYAPAVEAALRDAAPLGWPPAR